ncbi:MAG: hypothetical protein FWG90_03105 [Oscillospiraceae bacterium]|nr:hypothetical protein [Oscillospiraceae bacterium]
MSDIKEILKNKWVVLGLSILNGVFTACLCVFAYWVFLYRLEYTNIVIFAAVYSVFALLTGFLMFYTRKSPLTAVFCMLNIVVFFPVLLMDWGNWGLLAPAFIVAIFGFFCCRMNETVKTVLGTIFLLVYIIGGIAFFLMTTVFMVSTVDTVISKGESPSGDFRYYVLDQQNNASGKTAVYIEPNMLDVELGFLKLNTTIKRLISQTNNPAVVECEWKGTLLFINGKEYFNEEDFVTMKYGVRHYDFSTGNWTHTYFEMDYPFMKLVSSVTEAITDKLSERDEANGAA